MARLRLPFSASLFPAAPFHSAVGALLLGVSLLIVLACGLHFGPWTPRSESTLAVKTPRYRPAVIPAETSLPVDDGKAEAETVLVAQQSESVEHLSGSATPSSTLPEPASSRSGIRIAARNPDELTFADEPEYNAKEPQPEVFDQVEPRVIPDPEFEEPVDRTPRVPVPADSVASPDLLKSFEERVKSVLSEQLDEQSRRLEAATRQLELADRDRRLQSVEEGLNALREDQLKVEPVPVEPPAIVIVKSTDQPPLFDLDARHAETGAVFQQLAHAADVEIVVSRAVEGRVSLRLKAKTLDEALAELSRAQDCEVQADGNVRLVVPRRTVEGDLPASNSLITRVLHPRHVSAVELESFLRPLLTSEVGQISAMPAGGSEEGGAEPHGTLLVRDRAEAVQAIEELLQKLDVPFVEVDLTAQVFSVEMTGVHTRGVSLTAGPGAPGQGVLCPPFGGSSGANSATPSPTASLDFQKTPGGLRFAMARGDGESVVAALSQSAVTHPIGRPHVRMRNRQTAELVLSSLRDAGTEGWDDSERRLRVRPTVLDSGEVQLLVEESRPQVAAGHSVLSAEVTVRRGMTAIIGGIIETLPGSVNRREILVLLTPRVRGVQPAGAVPIPPAAAAAAGVASEPR